MLTANLRFPADERDDRMITETEEGKLDNHATSVYYYSFETDFW